MCKIDARNETNGGGGLEGGTRHSPAIVSGSKQIVNAQIEKWFH